ncbi:hypothetical protein [uncultured Rikenella sp.]|uniref:hypothetical protein n=1 Tax=uncultured Rikenella sp. TaxID=368003 RepID=UPI0026245B6D|nr:hypothetical protein [uncultured Rikenella sp.]
MKVKLTNKLNNNIIYCELTNNNISILNSYKIKSKKEMKIFLEVLPLYTIKRNINSCLNEWVAHNRLYKLGLFKEHTINTDLSKNESILRRIGYYLLSRGGKK